MLEQVSHILKNIVYQYASSFTLGHRQDIQNKEIEKC